MRSSERPTAKVGRSRFANPGSRRLFALLIEFLFYKTAQDGRVRTTFRSMHDLTDEEPDQSLLSAAIGLDLFTVLCHHFCDNSAQFAGIGYNREATRRYDPARRFVCRWKCSRTKTAISLPVAPGVRLRPFPWPR